MTCNTHDKKIIEIKSMNRILVDMSLYNKNESNRKHKQILLKKPPLPYCPKID